MEISIIIPYYNASKYFKNLLHSIENQTYKNFELIIINDGSTDNSVDLLNDLEKKYKYIKVVNKLNGGSASARNLGIKLATGKYLCMLDADDVIDEYYIEDLYMNIVKYNADISYCNFDIIKSYKQLFKMENNYIVLEKNNIDLINEYCEKNTNMRTCVLWNKMFKKDLFDNVNFVEGKSIDDEYIILKLLNRASKIVYIDKVLYHYYTENEFSQMNQNYSIKRLDSIDALEKNIEYLIQLDNDKIEYEKLYYTYFSLIIMNEYYLKKMGKTNIVNEQIKHLKIKKNKIYLAFLSKKINLTNKIILLIKYLFPFVYFRIRDLFKKA